ncbi:MAG: hypothetical protein KBE65_14530 [Phycisphaerae bacterium]|nr:hypothetical protein [Phycisphaerae bacterium]
MTTQTGVRSTACLFVFFLLANVLPAAQFAGGTGMPGDPYQIGTVEQLCSIGSDPDLLAKHFVLIADIDLDPNLPGRVVFVRAVIAGDTDDAFGFQGTPFTGYFDGNSHRIKNLTIESTAGHYVGLFGCIGDGGSVEDLVLENVSITGAHYKVGGLAGSSGGGIRGCHVRGNIRVGTRPSIESLGGLVGLNAGRILWSSAYTDVWGDSKGGSLGGFAGTNLGGRIASCHAAVSLTGSDYLGGFVGNNVEGVITDCYAQGTILTHYSPYSGGLVGHNRGGVIVNCYAATVLWTGSESEDWGGLIGVGSPRFYTGGRVVGDAVGNSFWDTEVSGVSVSDGGEGLLTSQMYQKKTFVGWDFESTWTICEGKDYPRLQWEGIDCNE